MRCGGATRIVVAAILLCAGSAARAQNTKTYKVRLAPVAMDLTMVPNIAGAGAATATLAGTKLTITGAFDGLKSPATIAQIHKGPVTGVRGPVLFDLTVANSTSGTVNGTVDLTPTQVTDLQKGRLYIQIHSEKAPEGNLWGWLLPEKSHARD